MNFAEMTKNAPPRLTGYLRGADYQPSTDAGKEPGVCPVSAAPADMETWLLFQGQCLPHLICLFSDALCLTGFPNVATSLVAETYRHACRTFRDCQPEQPLAGLSEEAVLTWLRRTMYACLRERDLGGPDGSAVRVFWAGTAPPTSAAPIHESQEWRDDPGTRWDL